MLPFDARTFTISIPDHAPVEKRGVPVPKDPKTIGEHLRRRRHELGLLQPQVTQILKVSQRTLSLWEWDKVYPAWAYQPRIIDFLGYDPFDDPTLGRPLGNESRDVAVLASKAPHTWGEKLQKKRLELRKTRKECAKDLGVSEKTLRSWESGLRSPTRASKDKVTRILHLTGE